MRISFLSLAAAAISLAAGCTPAAGDDAGSPAESGDAGASFADAGPLADTWHSFAADFMSTYCVSCHDDAATDYRLLEHVSRDAAPIRCGVSATALEGCGSWPPPRQFPVGSGPQPTDEERDRLVRWIDDGMLSE